MKVKVVTTVGDFVVDIGVSFEEYKAMLIREGFALRPDQHKMLFPGQLITIELVEG